MIQPNRRFGHSPEGGLRARRQIAFYYTDLPEPEPPVNEYVNPELAGGAAKDKEEANDAQGLLSQKLDDMLQEANLDAEKMTRLSESISSFAGAAEGMKPATDSIAASNRYAEQLSVAAIELESLNSMYIIQKENAERQASLNQETLENAERLKEQMESLATNLSSLNGVYGGMLSAMSNRNS